MTPYTSTFITSKANSRPVPMHDLAGRRAVRGDRRGRLRLGGAGRQFRPAIRDDHRRPVLQGPRQHGHPHRHPVDVQRTMLATGTFTNESARAGRNWTSPAGDGHRRHHIRSLLPHHTGHYADTRRPQTAVTNGPLTAEANGGVYAYGSRARSRPTAITGPTTGSTWSTTDGNQSAVGSDDIRATGNQRASRKSQ